MKKQILPEMILYLVVVIFPVFLSKSIDFFFYCFRVKISLRTSDLMGKLACINQNFIKKKKEMKGPDIKAPASIFFFPSKKTILIFYKQENNLLTI
jgi:hypothetical protein